MPENDDQSMTMEEAEVVQSVGEDVPTAAGEIQLSGETVPEEFQGKTAKDLLDQVKATREALQISEKAREDDKDKFRKAELDAVRAPVVPPPAPVEEVELSPEEMEELRNDPNRYTDYKIQKAAKLLGTNVDNRLKGLAESGVASAEQSARSNFKEDFELFGDQIDSLVSSLPDRTALASPTQWDNLITFVRGKPENIDKLIAHRATQSASVARQAQEASTGHTPPPMQNAPPAAAGEPKYDETQLEIMRTLGIESKDWEKWS